MRWMSPVLCAVACFAAVAAAEGAPVPLAFEGCLARGTGGCPTSDGSRMDRAF
jgi:hypothetical protein